MFEECQIHSADRGSATNNGYVTAASTHIAKPFGLLITNCRVTSDAADGTVYLGRHGIREETPTPSPVCYITAAI